MKKLIFTFAIVLCVLLLSCNSSNSKSTSNSEITYSSESCITLGNIKDWGAEIKSHEFNNGVGKITFKGKVTTVPESAFDDCDLLTSVTIPDSVTSIGGYAFYDCDSLTSVTIPDSVISIGVSAFYSCSSLTRVTIGNSVTEIGADAFRGCESLEAFYGKFASVDNRCLVIDNELRFFARGGLTSYSIPDNITSIGSDAFCYCTSLTSVTIPDSVTSIGNSAFCYCTSLTSVTIPDSVTSIGNYAFYHCTSLTSVTIPDSVTKIGDRTFFDCIWLESVYCKAKTPPTVGSNVFSTDYNPYAAIGCKIYVPRNSVEAYKSADGWKEYADNIVGYDF